MRCFECDGKPQAITILFAILQAKSWVSHRGLAGDGKVCDRELRQFAIMLSLQGRSSLLQGEAQKLEPQGQREAQAMY